MAENSRFVKALKLKVGISIAKNSCKSTTLTMEKS